VKADKKAVLYSGIEGQGVLNIYVFGFVLIPIEALGGKTALSY
jgi:hypothetical protein